MNIDHIFIFTDDKGQIADELVKFGFVEGSNRVHLGQGTTNRKFYFNNFFLEVLWVHHPNEIISDQTKPMGLWQRAEYKSNNFSPFGLCIVNEDYSEALFQNAIKYQPSYFPEGFTIDILKNDLQPSLPYTFRLPFKGQKQHEHEPLKHQNKIASLTKTIFEYKERVDDIFINYFKEDSNIEFLKSSRDWLNLVFDGGKQKQKANFKDLKLTISY